MKTDLRNLECEKLGARLPCLNELMTDADPDRFPSFYGNRSDFLNKYI